MLLQSMPNVHAGIQMNPIRLDSDSTTTLAADAVVQLNAGLSTGLSQSFLVKQISMNYRVTSANLEGTWIIGIANGTATLAEIASGIRDQVTDVDDASAVQVAALHQNIWWETLRCVGTSQDTNGDNQVINETISIGGGKGIPMKEATGIQVFAWNPTAATSPEGFVHGIFVVKGIWLND